MNFKKTILILGLIILVPASVLAGNAAEINGVYKELPGREFAYDGKTVEIIEFLSFYCGHCNSFERAIPVIKGHFPKKTKWKTVPIYWGKGSPKPSEAYMLAVDAGKGEQMKKEIFNAIFVENKDIGKIEILEELGTKIGLGFDFSMKLRSGAKAEEAKKAIEMAHAYQVDETPSLVIAGNLKTSPGDVTGNMDAFRINTISILESILNK